MADGASLPALPPLPLPAVPQDNESCSGMSDCFLFCRLLLLLFPSHIDRAPPCRLPPSPATVADTVVDTISCPSRHPSPSLPPVACRHRLPLLLMLSLMPSDCFDAVAAVAAVPAICCPHPLPVAISRAISAAVADGIAAAIPGAITAACLCLLTSPLSLSLPFSPARPR